MKKLNLLVILVTVFLFPAMTVQAADWPMWRFDAGRSNSTRHALPKELHLHWVRQLPPAQPAWDKTQTKLQFDAAPQPVVQGKRIFVPSTVNDNVTAYDTETGNELWRFYAGGPVRFAPVAYKNRIYFVSDDGHLYCLNSADGELEWKINGGPAERWIIGNHRLISTWPARGGPVLHDGRIFFTASIWPFMGIFIHAVDPDSGEIVWTNSGDGTNFITHPHGADSFGTVVPQGHLAASGDHLIVPGGRSTPAVYDVHTGKLIQFKFDGRYGGHDVAAAKDVYFVSGQVYRATDGKRLDSTAPVFLDGPQLFSATSSDSIQVEKMIGIRQVERIDRKGKKTKEWRFAREKLSQLSLEDSAGKVMIKAGNQIFTAGKACVTAFDLGEGESGNRKPFWSAQFDGQAHHMLAADNRLFIVTTDAKLYCFGPDKAKVVSHALSHAPLEKRKDVWIGKAAAYLKNVVAAQGYCVVLGIESDRLIDELLLQSKLHLVVVDPDAKKVDALRGRMQAAGLYGKRISVHKGDPATFAFPAYLASLVVSENASTLKLNSNKDLVQNLFNSLRPYGGRACFELNGDQHRDFVTLTSELKSQQAVVQRENDLTILEREGPLPGAADWTHQYGNAAQTGISKDKLVKAPLGLLWFGGPSHEKILPRHGHGPSPQVAGGRLFIEGPDMLRAVDVYTGLVLWEKQLKDFGKYYDTTRHFPGAGEIGSNYVSLPDNVYAVYGNAILELDAATGDLTREFKLKAEPGKEPPSWGYIGVWDDLLIATSSPIPAGSIASIAKEKTAAFLKGAIPLIKRHSKWKYLAGTDPRGDWTSVDFADEKWKNGTAGFGYGDGDDKTTLDMHDNFRRVYIRRTFEIDKLEEIKELGLAINFDDAFIAYLNGKEIVRAGVGRGSGPKASGIDSHEARGIEYFPIKNFTKLLQSGNNVLCIEGHNTSLTSSDFSLDPYLVYRKTRSKVASKPKKNDAAKTTSQPLPVGKYASGSKVLTVFNRHTGELLWTKEADFNFRHNNIAAGNGTIYCIDNITDERRKALARRGINFAGQPVLYAFDARTGAVRWSTKENVFGTFLNYSEENDVLLQAGSQYRDRARDEVNKGMVAYRGADGKVLWKDLAIKYSGPCLLRHDKIITNGAGGFAIDMKTGKRTGWKYERKYGCNTALGGEHLLTFRSGCAGFFDLENNSGTGNLGGFRSSCTNNLIIANGVLNAPDYTRTCTCAYQNQTSLALIHMPDAEFWTFGGHSTPGQMGFNFGAPGDRRAPNGTLWKAKGKVKMEPANPEVFRLHSTLIEGDSHKWVAASGVVGVKRITIDVDKGKGYKVRLHFLEPKEMKIGERVFDVLLQGEKVLANLDIVRQVGQCLTAFTTDFELTAQTGTITIELFPKRDRFTVISGVEVIQKSG